jgi:UDP-glucose 4-epimerase
MNQKILIIGGTGFIGKHLVAKLATEGHQVRVFSRHARANGYAKYGVEYMAGDFLSLEQLQPALADVQTIYHLAVTTVPGSSNEKILYDAQTNLMGTLHLLEAAAESRVKRFIFVSSGGSVYGPTPNEPINEEYPTAPISAHAVSKLAIEKYLEIYRRTYGLEYRVARAGNPYGKWQNPDKGQGFVGRVLGQMAREANGSRTAEEQIVIWGDGSVVRDFFYVGDLVEALCLMRDDDGPYRLYNVGSGRGKSLREIIELLQSITGQMANIKYEAARPADVPYNSLDVTRIKESLGWQPKTNFHVGVADTWRWMREYVTKQALTPTACAHGLPSSDSWGGI